MEVARQKPASNGIHLFSTHGHKGVPCEQTVNTRSQTLYLHLCTTSPSPDLRMYATLDLYHFSIPHSYKIWPNCFNMTLVYILLACRCIARLPHQRSPNSCSLHFIVFIGHTIKLQPHVLLNKHMHPATRRHIILEHVICALATLSTCHLST